MKERAIRESGDGQVRSSGVSIDIVDKFIAFNGICKVKEVNHTTTVLHGELNGWIQIIHERKELSDGFIWAVPNTINIIDVTSPKGDV